MKCPICKKDVAPESGFYPFCSERCRTIDLGKWASGDYVIPAPLEDAEERIGEVPPEREDEES